MNKEKLHRAIGEIDDSIIEDALNYNPKAPREKKFVLRKILAVSCCFAMLLVVALLPSYLNGGRDNIMNGISGTAMTYTFSTEEELYGFVALNSENKTNSDKVMGSIVVENASYETNFFTVENQDDLVELAEIEYVIGAKEENVNSIITTKYQLKNEEKSQNAVEIKTLAVTDVDEYYRQIISGSGCDVDYEKDVAYYDFYIENLGNYRKYIAILGEEIIEILVSEKLIEIINPATICKKSLSVED